MTPLDFLYISLGVGFLIIAVGCGFVSYHLVQNLKVSKSLIEDVADTAHDVQELKNTLKFGGLSILSKVMKVVAGKN